MRDRGTAKILEKDRKLRYKNASGSRSAKELTEPLWERRLLYYDEKP